VKKLFTEDENWDLLLDPREAKQRLQAIYADAGTNKAFLRREVKDIRKKCEADPLYFMSTCFPHRFTQDGKISFCPKHKELLERCNRKNKLQLISCFRGFGKSTIGNFGLNLYDICLNKADFIVIASFNERMCRKLIFPIQLEIENNPRLHQLFGEQKGGRMWSTQSLLTKNGVRLEGLGIGQTIRGALDSKGQRPEVLCLDDLISSEASRSPIQKEALLHWLFSDLLPSLKPDEFRARLFCTMISSESAIFDLFYHEDYKNKSEPFIVNILDKKGNSTWPERFPQNIIKRIKETVTEFAWHGEYMFPPISSSALLFHPEWKSWYREEELIGLDLINVAFLDPAARTGQANDYTALIILSLDRQTGHMYVRRGTWYRKATEDDIVKHCYVIDTMHSFTTDDGTKIGITLTFEANGFQRLFKYIFDLHQKIKGYQPKTKLIERKGDKLLMMMGLIPYLSHGMISFLEGDPDIQRGVEDMFKVTHQKNSRRHDDFPDALIGAVSELQMIVRCLAFSASDTPEQGHHSRQMKSIVDIREKSHPRQQNPLDDFLLQLYASSPAEKRKIPKWELRVRGDIEHDRTMQCSMEEYTHIKNLLQRMSQEFIGTENEKALRCLKEIQSLDARFMKNDFE